MTFTIRATRESGFNLLEGVIKSAGGKITKEIVDQSSNERVISIEFTKSLDQAKLLKNLKTLSNVKNIQMGT